MNKSYYDPMDLTNFPHISVIIPYSPEMSKPKGLVKCLASATEKAEKQLQNKYPPEDAAPLVKKLHDAVHDIKCCKDEKSLAIFISPVSQKIYYFTPSSNRNNYMPSVLVEQQD